MGSFEAFTFVFQERAAGVALVDIGGEPVKGGQRDLVFYEKELFSYVGAGVRGWVGCC